MKEAEDALHAYKQALAQVVFYHLDQLKHHFVDADAVALIGEELEKMQGMFTTASLPSLSLNSSLDELEKDWTDRYTKAIKANRYSEARDAEDGLDAVRTLKRLMEDTSK